MLSATVRKHAAMPRRPIAAAHNAIANIATEGAHVRCRRCHAIGGVSTDADGRPVQFVVHNVEKHCAHWPLDLCAHCGVKTVRNTQNGVHRALGECFGCKRVIASTAELVQYDPTTMHARLYAAAQARARRHDRTVFPGAGAQLRTYADDAQLAAAAVARASAEATRLRAEAAKKHADADSKQSTYTAYVTAATLAAKAADRKKADAKSAARAAAAAAADALRATDAAANLTLGKRKRPATAPTTLATATVAVEEAEEDDVDSDSSSSDDSASDSSSSSGSVTEDLQVAPAAPPAAKRARHVAPAADPAPAAGADTGADAQQQHGPVPRSAVRPGFKGEVFRVGARRAAGRRDANIDDCTGTGCFVPITVTAVSARTGSYTVHAADVQHYTGSALESTERNVPHVYARRERTAAEAHADKLANAFAHGAAVDTRWFVFTDNDEHKRWYPSRIVGRFCYECDAESAPGTCTVALHAPTCSYADGADGDYGYIVEADYAVRAHIQPVDVRAPTDTSAEPAARRPTRAYGAA